MRIQVLEDRLVIQLKLHTFAASRWLNRAPHQPLSISATELSSLAVPLFKKTLGQSVPSMQEKTCEWRNPELKALEGADRDFVELQVVAICGFSTWAGLKLSVPMPFLSTAPPAFQVLARVESQDRVEPLSLIANSKRPFIEVGPQNLKSVGGFFQMGIAHIGVLPQEWHAPDGSLKRPDGLDHIFFVLALVLSGGTLWGLVQCISGFTLGHSITLGLSTFKWIHVHSHWVEALIAFSIAYVAAMALVQSKNRHRWIVAAAFGTVHGLGFASALQELDLTRSEIWPALLGFNLGVELGQLVIVLLSFPLLFWLAREAPQVHLWVHRALAVGLLLTGTYWFLLRAID